MSEPVHKVSKRGRAGEGRPTKRTPEVVAKIAKAVSIGLTDGEAALLAGINPDTMTEWHKDAEFSGAIKRATAQRLLLRLERIEAGEQGWQGTAWALERIYGGALFALGNWPNFSMQRFHMLEQPLHEALRALTFQFSPDS